MRRITHLALLCMLLVVDEAFAQGAAGLTQAGNGDRSLAAQGSGILAARRGGRRGGRRRGGRRRGTTSEDQRRKLQQQQAAAHAQHKQQMPAPEKPGELDSYIFDRVGNELALSLEQEGRIREAKRKITEKGARLLRVQDEARKAFQATTEAACAEAAQRVMAAAQAIRDFRPGRDFASAVNFILTAAQRAKYQELLKGHAGPGMAGPGAGKPDWKGPNR